MSEQKAQAFWVPSGATLRLPPRMRLAPSETERLWKGLERFVNCDDSESDYKALGHAFPDFWPVEIWHYPNQESHGPHALPPLNTALGTSVLVSKGLAAGKGELSEADVEKMEWESQTETLNWHFACRKLFIFYRETLREVWRGEPLEFRSVEDRPTLADLSRPTRTGWLAGRAHEFLLGIMDYNEEACERAKNEGFDLNLTRPIALDMIWQEIFNQFPTVAVEGRVEISMLWRMGDFSLVPHNDFQRAFYLLFRQNWKARVCPRCNMFFVARKPKQIFCGTGCSAGNRLASKRKWWNRVGAKRRARQRQRVSGRSRRERKNR